MTPPQMVDMFRQQSTSFLDAAVEAVGEVSAGLDYSEAAKASLMAGMIVWRHRLGDPSSELDRTIEISRRAVRALAAVNVSVWSTFDVTKAVFVSHLLGRPGKDLLAAACPLIERNAHRGRFMSQAVDAALLSYLDNGQVPEALPAVLDELRQQKRMRLFAETYSNYLDLLMASGQNEALKHVAIAGELFLKRGRDAAYESADTEGGGPYNEHVVDLRLAALINVSAPGIVEQLRETRFPHLWPPESSRWQA